MIRHKCDVRSRRDLVAGSSAPAVFLLWDRSWSGRCAATVARTRASILAADGEERARTSPKRNPPVPERRLHLFDRLKSESKRWRRRRGGGGAPPGTNEGGPLPARGGGVRE